MIQRFGGYFSAAVEGPTDEAVLRRLLLDVGGSLGIVYGRNGKEDLRRNLRGYNSAARFAPWIVLVDLNHEAPCPPPLVHAWLPAPAQYMILRVAVREIESWLLADHESLSSFLLVRRALIHPNPETLDDPKRAMIDLARKSRSRAIREDMVPRKGSGRQVGPAYTSRLIEFADDLASGWRPEIAAERVPSLRRCLVRLRTFLQGA